MSNPPRAPKKNRAFKIEAADLNLAQTSEVVDHMRRAQEVPLVREVGTDKKSYGGLRYLRMNVWGACRRPRLFTRGA
jgi:hypothetical protein